MINETALAEALQGCEQAARRVLDAVDELARARDARDDCLFAVAAAGVSKNSAPTVIREHLARQGWTSDQIAAVGLSLGTAKLAFRRRPGAGEADA